MSKNLKALQQALNTATNTAAQRPSPRRVPAAAAKAAPVETVVKAPPVAAVEPPVPANSSRPPSQGSYMAPSREGKTNITAYLSPDFKSSLRLIQARTGKSLQTLIAEALNDMFGKYDVPVVRGD